MATMIKVMICSLLAAGCVDALPTNMETMRVSRMKKADLESSATGYSYQQQHGAPASYVHYNNHGAQSYHDAPVPVQYVAAAPQTVIYAAPEPFVQYQPAPVQYVKKEPVHYDAALPAGYVVPLLTPKEEPRAPYYAPARVEEVPEKIEIADDEGKSNDDGEGDYGDEDEDEDDEYDHDDGFEHGDFEVPTKAFGHSGFDEPDRILVAVEAPVKVAASDFEQGGGEKNDAEEYSSHGEKGDKGYKGYHGVDESQKGEHDKENHKGQYSADAGHKVSHSDTDGYHSSHGESAKGEKGASFGKESHHKKGHKTNGFHNVYHKDEYKKDTDFYDEDHNSGHFKKHAESDEHHAAAEGGFKNGNQHNSGYDQKESGKGGAFDKGHDLSDHKSHKSVEGQDSYHENHADYAAKGDSGSTKEHGYSKGHGHPSKLLV